MFWFLLRLVTFHLIAKDHGGHRFFDFFFHDDVWWLRRTYYSRWCRRHVGENFVGWGTLLLKLVITAPTTPLRRELDLKHWRLIIFRHRTLYIRYQLLLLIHTLHQLPFQCFQLLLKMVSISIFACRVKTRTRINVFWFFLQDVKRFALHGNFLLV